MAWRIEEQVVRGEIDNRTRDLVTGRVWLIGRTDPIVLELKGNAWRDLAGRRLIFTNPAPQAGSHESLATEQRGVIGDCTASRKVKVPDVSFDEMMRLVKAGQTFPWHWGNSLYFEWFSEINGRVVIESASYALTITDVPLWHMTAEEEEEQRQQNAHAMSEFMGRLSGLSPAAPTEDQEENEPSEDGPVEDEPVEDSDSEARDEDWEPIRPMTEDEAEALQAESDRLSDRIQARLDREGPDADISSIIEEELERRREERGDKPLTPEQEAERSAWMDEMNRAAEEALAHPDPELEAELNFKHPLAEQAFELTLRLHREPEERGWVPASAGREHPVVELINATNCAGAKLAGALNGGSWPPELDICANSIVRLKRARGYLDDALMAAGDCAEQQLVDAVWLVGIRKELEEIGHACDELIIELRTRLERGFE